MTSQVISQQSDSWGRGAVVVGLAQMQGKAASSTNAHGKQGQDTRLKPGETVCGDRPGHTHGSRTGGITKGSRLAL